MIGAPLLSDLQSKTVMSEQEKLQSKVVMIRITVVLAAFQILKIPWHQPALRA